MILVLPLILGCLNSRPHTDRHKLSLTESHVPPALEFSVFKAVWIEITFLIKRAGPIYHFKNRKLKKQRRNEISFLPVLTEQGLLLATCCFLSGALFSVHKYSLGNLNQYIQKFYCALKKLSHFQSLYILGSHSFNRHITVIRTIYLKKKQFLHTTFKFFLVCSYSLYIFEVFGMILKTVNYTQNKI